MNKHGGYHGEDPDVLDFSVNINPFGMPKNLEKVLVQSMNTLEKYPEISGESNLRKLGKDLGIDPKHLILGNGAIELIYLFARSLEADCNEEKPKALIIQPTFNEYERALSLYGWEIKDFVLTKSEKFRIDPQKLRLEIENYGPKAVFLCNPNNPTGVVYSKKFIEDLMDFSPKEVCWFIDESFIDFSSEEDGLELILKERNPLFLLRSLTKFYGLPGLRVGYGLGSKEIIKKMMKYKEPWTINALALGVIKKILDEKEYKEVTKRYIENERNEVYNKLKSFDYLNVYKSDADFHLCQIKQGNLGKLVSFLEKKKVIIRTCEDFHGLDETYFRIAIKKEKDNHYLMNCLSQWRG
ncbi:MAG: pyridoxal phosphate-dependent aminotransferase [Eubacteriaceae bacterium]